MKIAIISSRFGATNLQLRAFKEFIKDCTPETDRFIIGGDAGDISIYEILVTGRWPVEIYPHSSSNTDYEFRDATKANQPQVLKTRNKAMVDDSNIILALPQAMNESEDSPNWKTIRYAASNLKQVYCISPVGWIWELENNRE